MKNYSNYNVAIVNTQNDLDNMVEWAKEYDQDVLPYIRVAQQYVSRLDNIVSYGEWDDRTLELDHLTAWFHEQFIYTRDQVKQRNEAKNNKKRKDIEARIAELQKELNNLK